VFSGRRRVRVVERQVADLYSAHLRLLACLAEAGALPNTVYLNLFHKLEVDALERARPVCGGKEKVPIRLELPTPDWACAGKEKDYDYAQ